MHGLRSAHGPGRKWAPGFGANGDFRTRQRSACRRLPRLVPTCTPSEYSGKAGKPAIGPGRRPSRPFGIRLARPFVRLQSECSTVTPNLSPSLVHLLFYFSSRFVHVQFTYFAGSASLTFPRARATAAGGGRMRPATIASGSGRARLGISARPSKTRSAPQDPSHGKTPAYSSALAAALRPRLRVLHGRSL